MIIQCLFRLMCCYASITFCLQASKLPLRTFGFEQGLPRNSASCLFAGTNGLIWICTSEGLVRFDGYRFRVFGSEHGLASGNITDFIPAKAGGYWLMSANGVCRLASDSKIGEPCKRARSTLRPGEFSDGSLLETRDGKLWAAAGGVLYRLVASRNELLPTPLHIRSANLLMQLTEGPDGSVLASTEEGLFKCSRDGIVTKLSGSLGSLHFTSKAVKLATAWWIGTADGLMRLSFDAQGQALFSQALSTKRWIFATLVRNDGSLWIADDTGIARIAVDQSGQATEAERYGRKDGLPNDEVDHIAEDSEGDLWGATQGAGLFRIQRDGFTTHSEADGLGNARIASVFEDQAGRLCVMTTWNGENLHVRDGDRFKKVAVNYPAHLSSKGWGWNQFGLQDHAGDWWIPSGEGLLRFPALRSVEQISGATPIWYGKQSPLEADDVFRTFEDSAHDIWIACYKPEPRLYRWERNSQQFRRWTSEDGLPANLIVTAFREDRDGNLWLSTNGPMVHFCRGEFKIVPLDTGQMDHETRDVLIDRQQRVWVATHKGLFRCDRPDDFAPKFVRYGVAQGLASDVTRSLTEDAAGRIYVGTVRGVDQIDTRLAGGLGLIRHFTTADGLPDSEQNVAFRDRAGHLWFGTLRGLAECDPAKFRVDQPPRVVLTRVRVRGRERPLPWDGAETMRLDLGYNENQLEIECAAVNPHSVASTRYQYRLGAEATNWGDSTGAFTVDYASLPLGRTSFQVRAVDAFGRISRPASIDLFVDVPMWRQWWFLMVMFASVGVAAFALYNYRVHHLMAVHRVRIRIAADLHDDVGASLSQISILSEVARRNHRPEGLDEIAAISRAAVSDMSDIIWAVNPLHDHFRALSSRMRRFAGDTLGGAAIELDFKIDLPADFTLPLHLNRPLYLVFKEVVNNAAKHSRATRALIRLELRNRQLELTISDNGVGLPAEATTVGEGLASVRRRITELKGSVKWDSLPGSGTTFLAAIPVRDASRLHNLIAILRRLRD